MRGISILSLVTIVLPGRPDTTSGNPKSVQTPPPTPSGTPVRVGHLVVNEDHNNATVKMGLNENLTIILKENPTTGFQWILTTSQGLAVITDNYLPSTPQLTGSGGVHSWDIMPLIAGNHKIKAIYMRSWEPETGKETTFSMTVTVKNP